MTDGWVDSVFGLTDRKCMTVPHRRLVKVGHLAGGMELSSIRQITLVVGSKRYKIREASSKWVTIGVVLGHLLFWIYVNNMSGGLDPYLIMFPSDAKVMREIKNVGDSINL